jgi:nitrite reductase/ring-hydroxylating ferredoxin subunit
MTQPMASQSVYLANIHDIPEGEGRDYHVNGHYVAVFHYEGQFYALEDICPHAGAPLYNGDLRDGTVMCMWHGWRFNLHDGVCINLPRACNVNTFPVTIRGQDLYVTLPVNNAESA